MLVVLAIIGILASMLLPSLKRAYETSKAIACTNQFKQIGIAVTLYSNDNKDFVPIAHTASNSAWKWTVIEPNGTLKSSYVNWTNRIAPTYLNDPKILICPAAPTDELNHMGDGWKSNYTYNAYLGWIVGTSGDASQPNGGMKKSTSCRFSSKASLVVDGQNKSRYTTAFMRTASRPVSRHQGSWNVLFADGHSSTDRDDLLTNGIFPSLYFSSSYGNANSNVHARLVYQYEIGDGSIWTKYW